MTVEIKDKLYQEILQYCQINNFDIELEINKYIQTGFNCEKYGDLLYVAQSTIHGEEKKIQEPPLEEVKKVEPIQDIKQSPPKNVVKHKIRIIEDD